MAGHRNFILSITTRLLVCVALLGGSVAIAKYLVATREEPVTSTRGQELPRVPVIEARERQVQRQWRGFGTAQAMHTSDVPARVASVVEHVPDHVRAGATVRKGDPIARLDARDFQRQLEIAQQLLVQTEAELRQLEVEQRYLQDRLKLDRDDEQLAAAEAARVEGMRKNNAATPQDLDRARQTVIRAAQASLQTSESLDRVGPRRARLEAQLSSQRSAIARAQQDVERCEIVSPRDGVIEQVDVDDGEEVAVGRRVARVVSLDRIEVPLRLPAAARAHIGVGDSVRLSATSGLPHVWSAPITRVAPVDDRDSRTIAVYVELAQSEDAVRSLAPGQFVQGEVAERQARTCWVLPRQAISGDRIMVVNGNRLVSRPASVQFQLERRFEDSGLNDNQWVAVAAALADGDLVVVHNGPSLMDGQMVQPVVAGAPASTADAERRGSQD